MISLASFSIICVVPVVHRERGRSPPVREAKRAADLPCGPTGATGTASRRPRKAQDQEGGVGETKNAMRVMTRKAENRVAVCL